MAGGLLAAQVAILGLPAIPPIQANDWFALLVLAAAGIGLADALIDLPGWLRWGLRTLTSAALPGLLLLPLLEHSWSPGEGIALLAG